MISSKWQARLCNHKCRWVLSRWLFDYLDKSRSRPETSHVEKLQHVLPSSPLACHAGAVCPPEMEPEGLRGVRDGAGRTLLSRQEMWKPPPWWETPSRRDARARRDCEVPDCLLVTRVGISASILAMRSRFTQLRSWRQCLHSRSKKGVTLLVLNLLPQLKSSEGLDWILLWL